METIFKGRWWKYSDYKIDDRGCLCPDFSGKLTEYDPWQEYWAWVQDWRTNRPPYLKLFDLNLDMSDEYIHDAHSNSLRNDPFPGYSRHTGGLDNIIERCNQYGLLGILPYKLRSIDYQKVSECERTRLSQKRIGGSWESYLTDNDNCDRIAIEDIANQESGSGDWKMIGGDIFTISDQYPTVNYQHNLSSTLRWFVPGGQNKQDKSTFFPEPLSTEFWENYVEPLHEFRDGIELLYVSTISLLGDSTSLGYEKQNAARCLNILAEQVTNTILTKKDGKLDFFTFSPSLLNTYAAMILMDLAAGSRLHLCIECNKIFASGTKRATYCSTACRNRYNLKKYRERHNTTRDF